VNYAIEDEKAFAFLAALQEQFEIYTSLLLKSDEQSRLVELGDEEGLLRLIQEKKEDISRLDMLSKAFEKERALLEELPMGSFSSIDLEIDKVLEAIEKALQRLVENEARDVNALKSNQGEQLDKIMHLEKGQKLTQAYLSKGSGKNMDLSV
jgi:hypothetical protein